MHDALGVDEGQVTALREGVAAVLVSGAEQITSQARREPFESEVIGRHFGEPEKTEGTTQGF